MKTCHSNIYAQDNATFSSLPNELIVNILTQYKAHEPSFLSLIACVCKVWNKIVPNIRFIWLNEGKIRLIHIPSIHKRKNHRRTPLITQYLKLLNSLSYLDLADLRQFNEDSLKKIKFENFQTIVRHQCSLKDTLILPKFTQIQHLDIGPNYNTDLTFLFTLTKLNTLSLRFSIQAIFTKALATLSQLNTISSLTLRASECLSFTNEFRLPDQLKRLSLIGFNFTSDILSESSEVEHIVLKNTFLKKPVTFNQFRNLTYLSLGIQEDLKSLTIKELKLDYLEISVDSLKKLIIYDCNLKNFSHTCPLIEKVNYLSSGRQGRNK